MLNHTEYADWIVNEIKASNSIGLMAIEKVANNRLAITIQNGGHDLRYRVLLYAVGAAGRSNPLERRVEITSTYSGGLTPLPGYVDVVMGVEREKRLLVGIDPRRLSHGGATHNASTFVYLPSFNKLAAGGWFPMQIATQLFDSEYQIYLKPAFLLDYLKQHKTLHKSGIATFPSALVKENVLDQIDLYSANGSKTELSYEQQLALAIKKMQVGRIGESIVFEAEKERLIKSGAKFLSDKVNWISQQQPYLGYDIVSYNTSASEEYIEVKSSVSKMRSFYFTSNEMKVAKARGESYRLVCVSDVMKQPVVREFRNPVKAISSGILAIEYDTFLVAIKG